MRHVLGAALVLVHTACGSSNGAGGPPEVAGRGGGGLGAESGEAGEGANGGTEPVATGGKSGKAGSSSGMSKGGSAHTAGNRSSDAGEAGDDAPGNGGRAGRNSGGGGGRETSGGANSGGRTAGGHSGDSATSGGEGGAGANGEAGVSGEGGTSGASGEAGEAGASSGGVGASSGGAGASSGGAGASSGGAGASSGGAGASSGGAGASSGGAGASSGGGGAGSGGASGASGTAGSGGSAPGCSAAAAPSIAGLGLTTAVYDAALGSIVYASQPPGSTDWYLVDQRGRIRVWSGGGLRSAPFLDVTAEVELGEGDFNGITEYDDRGLVGLTFAPDYAESGLFYVALIPSKTSSSEHDHRQIREYRRSAGDPYLSETTRTRTLLDVPSSSIMWGNIHHASTVLFGADGMLYTALGDGGTPTCNAAEPNAPQDIASVFGKVLRLDPKKTEPPYAADGNPFAVGGDPRVLHYGLRNPFRFNFDSLTGDLFLGDVGQSSYEEISYAPVATQGLNFGWAAFEGNTNTCPSRALRSGSTHTPPIFAASRRALSCTGKYCDYQAAVAGTVYRGSGIPELYGAFLFGDVYGDRMNLLYQCESATSPLTILRKECDPNFPTEACFHPTDASPAISRLMAIVEGRDHELYLVVNRNRLLKVVAAP